MVEDKNGSESKAETLYSKVIPKMTKDGKSQVGSHLIEVKFSRVTSFYRLHRRSLHLQTNLRKRLGLQ